MIIFENLLDNNKYFYISEISPGSTLGSGLRAHEVGTD